MKDNWAERNKRQICQTCVYYSIKLSQNDKEVGRCKRYAPSRTGFPVVFPTDWCGEHKLDEAVYVTGPTP